MNEAETKELCRELINEREEERAGRLKRDIGIASGILFLVLAVTFGVGKGNFVDWIRSQAIDAIETEAGESARNTYAAAAAEARVAADSLIELLSVTSDFSWDLVVVRGGDSRLGDDPVAYCPPGYFATGGGYTNVRALRHYFPLEDDRTLPHAANPPIGFLPSPDRTAEEERSNFAICLRLPGSPDGEWEWMQWEWGRPWR